MNVESDDPVVVSSMIKNASDPGEDGTVVVVEEAGEAEDEARVVMRYVDESRVGMIEVIGSTENQTLVNVRTCTWTYDQYNLI